MNRWMKLAIVLASYALALLVSWVAVAVFDRGFSPAANQTMGGMIAGGGMMYGSGVFLLAALAPTGLGLWFVRRHRPSWSALTIVCLAFAVAGLVATFTKTFERAVSTSAPLLVLVDGFSLVQMLASPLFIAAFGLFTLLAPARDLRLRMLVALGIEFLIAGCGILNFLASRLGSG